MPFLILILVFAFLPIFGDGQPSYQKAGKELVVAWEKLYPLPFKNITKQDPLRHGVKFEKRKDKRKVWIYNFNVFMPKYDRNNNEPSAREEGRKILVFFLWEPENSEEMYRIQLGELNENL